jgi:predicted nucleotidyltransferase component of viral defense system
MMNKDEIEAYKVFADPYQTEKDYLQDLLLREIYYNKQMTGTLVFKGGTALSKFYYSNRFSGDLDFTAIGTHPEPEAIYDAMAQVCKSVPYSSSLTRKPSINMFGTITAEAAIEGPRYAKRESTLQRIGFEINTVSMLRYEPIPMIRRPVYSDAAEYTALVMDRREILSEKVRALMSRARRHKERDVYDLYFLLGKGTEPDIGLISEKLKQSKMEFSKNAFLGSMASAENTWGQLEPFLAQRLPDCKTVKEFVESKLKKAGLL